MNSVISHENGNYTMALQEKFVVKLELPGIKLNESYTETRNGDFQRNISFQEKVSEQFIIGQSINSTSSWCVIFKCGDTNPDNAGNHATIGLKLIEVHSKSTAYLYSQFKISVVDKDGDLLHFKNWRSSSSPRKIFIGESHVMPDFILLSDLLESKDFLMSENILRLRCEGVLYGDFQHYPLSIVRNPVQPPPETNMELWKHMKYCNVQLVSRDGRACKAHKSILGRASPVLNDMQLTLEGSGDGEPMHSLYLEDLGHEEILKLLQFIYTGDVEQDWNKYAEVERLLSAANNYEVRNLQRFCFAKTLTTINLTTLITLADLFQTYGAEPMYQAVLYEFFLSNQGKLVRQPSFQQFAKEKKEAFLYLTLSHEHR